MKENIQSRLLPQSKIMAVNDKFGNPGMAKQQGTTVEIYDAVKLIPTQQSYEFFINAKTKVFPFTNLLDGKLQPQESFVLSRAYFSLMEVKADGTIVEVAPLTLAADPGFAAGEMAFFIVNQRVIRPMPMRSFFPEFNENADSTTQNVFNFDTQLVIPPLLEFKAVVNFPINFFTAPPAGSDVYLVLTIGGPGGIFAPKSNY